MYICARQNEYIHFRAHLIYLLHIYYHVRHNKIRLQDKANHENEIGVTH